MTIVVGIDLGTSNSSMCFYDKDGNMQIIYDGTSCNIPSVITFTKYGCVFGNQAKMIKDNNIFISNIKRLIGYKYDDLPSDYYKQFPFEIINNDGNIGIKNGDVIYSPIELITYFLNYLKRLIEYEILTEYNVIVTVPAYFSILQKEIIGECITNVGFNLVKLLNEPTSAAISYGNFINFNDDDNILVFDLGGGTLDLSILNITYDEELGQTYEVIATYGNNKFGGSDLTFKLMDYIKTKYCDYNLDNNNLFDYIDKFKINLNQGIEQEMICINNQEIVMTIHEFDKIANDWLENIEENIDQALKNGKLTKYDIDHILLVGGTSKIKQIKTKLSEYFDKEIKNYFLHNTTIQMEDIAVAHGSAYHGFVLKSKKDILLMDICPFNIGIETANGTMANIITANSKVPIRKTQKFTTDEDNTTNVKIKIFQGDSKFTKKNIYLGSFILDNIPKAAKGVPVINVSIEIDNNGLLNVKACDKFDKTSNHITISAKDYKLDSTDVDKIKEKMTQNKQSENILFDLIEKYNIFLLNFDKFIYSFLINPVVELDLGFKNDIICDIQKKILEIYFLIKLESFDSFLSFDKFIHLTHILFDHKIPSEYIVKDFTKNHESALIYLKNKFYEMNKYLEEKYPNFIINLNNDTMNEQTYDKTNDVCDISDVGFSKTDGIVDFNRRLLKNTLMSDLNDMEKQNPFLIDYNIKLYEYSELINGLLDCMETIPLTIVGKNLLINFIDDDQTELNKLLDNEKYYENTQLLIQSIAKINKYCTELASKYYFDYSSNNDDHCSVEI